VIYDALPPVEVVEGLRPDAIPASVFGSEHPLVLKGLVTDWPAVSGKGPGEGSYDELEDYLSKFWTEQPVTAYVAGPDARGRFGYNDAFNGFNFRPGRAPLKDIFQRLREQQALTEEQRSAIYVGSTPVAGWLPGFEQANALSVPGKPLVNFWLGNRTIVSAHYDFPSNIACVVRGRRRFTFFPIDQVDNLYVGPIDRTPSGQPISLVDFDAPDFERFPRFKDALVHGQTTELEPGDAIFIPSMWWHHVKALADCNMLVNYWWLDNPEYQGSPFTALLHGVLSIRNLPERQRRAWQLLMNHYVFDARDDSIEHIPPQGLGCLGDLNENEANRLRTELVNRLK